MLAISPESMCQENNLDLEFWESNFKAQESTVQQKGGGTYEGGGWQAQWDWRELGSPNRVRMPSSRWHTAFPLSLVQGCSFSPRGRGLE